MSSLAFFIDDSILWKIDFYQRRVEAFDVDAAKPRWSADGVVFQSPRFLGANKPLSDASNAIVAADRCAVAASGRVYFLLDDFDYPSDENAENFPAFNLLIALDPRAQGRLVWTRRADDFALFFPLESEGQRCRISAPPRPEEGDVLSVEIRRGRFARSFRLNAADGSVRENAN